jgi:polysaccharide deacetylase family protein (PEP-CTERM system associated)
MKLTPNPSTLLFSIDLEEFYPAEKACNPNSSPLPELVEQYLELLREHDTHGTFFVVGEVARNFPSLLRAIVAEGHELGCHGDRHQTIDSFDPITFSEDLRANQAAIEEAAGTQVHGFRAPLLSLTEHTSWAFSVLAKEGFKYSSSVLPAANPLYGWPGFGASPRRVDGIWELPVTVARVALLGTLPIYCGTYFRVLPWWFVRHHIPAAKRQLPLVSYFHPYDIDHRQPWTMHAGVRGRWALNVLLFLRRRSLPGRIERLLQACPGRNTYSEYVARRCIAS